MNNTKHCELCDLQLKDFNKGLLCSITNKKPAFSRTCMKIKIEDIAREKIIEVNEEFQNLKHTKRQALFSFVFYTVIGLGVIYLSYLIGVKFLERGYFSTITLVIFAIGIGVLGLGFGPLNYYIRDKNIIVPKKNNLDKITDLYNVNYHFETKINTDMMGVKETVSTLDMNGKKTESIKRE